jgi:hypothetical protein
MGQGQLSFPRAKLAPMNIWPSNNVALLCLRYNVQVSFLKLEPGMLLSRQEVFLTVNFDDLPYLIPGTLWREATGQGCYEGWPRVTHYY